MTFSRTLARARRHLSVRRKNARINRNVRCFLDSHASNAHQPRESTFSVEVLIPCYNHGAYLCDALASVPDGYAVTVIDDASTDDTPRIIETLRGEFNFRVLRNERNLLQSGSLNRAVLESPANLFIVLNADDCLLPYTVATIIDVMRELPGTRLVGGGAILFAEASTLRLAKLLPDSLGYRPAACIYSAEVARTYHKLNDINMTMSGSAFLRSAWDAVGGFLDFPDRVCSFDDRDFQMRVSCLFDVAVIEEPLAFYRVTSSLGRAEFTD